MTTLPLYGTVVLAFLIFCSCSLSQSQSSNDDHLGDNLPPGHNNCTDPVNMAFDSTRNKCVMLAGRTCTPDALTPIGNCVENAYCYTEGSESYCVCLPYSSYESSEGLCPDRKSAGHSCSSYKECKSNLICYKGVCVQGNASYGQPCGEGIICDNWAGLSCIHNTCNCTNPDTMFYDEKGSQCLVLAGKLCFANERVLGAGCVDRAECAIRNQVGRCLCRYSFENSTGFCDPNKTVGENCTEDVQCEDYEQLTCVHGTCTFSNASYGEPCGGEVQCDPKRESRFSCINKSCQCGSGMIYDKENEKCSIPEGGSCYESGMDCDYNARCDFRRGFICRCTVPELFYRSAEGFCTQTGKLGENCTGDDNVNNREEMPLSCVDGVWSCPPLFTVLNPATKKCDRKVGIRCKHHSDCVSNAVCADNKCQCNSGHVCPSLKDY